MCSQCWNKLSLLYSKGWKSRIKLTKNYLKFLLETSNDLIHKLKISCKKMNFNQKKWTLKNLIKKKNIKSMLKQICHQKKVGLILLWLATFQSNNSQKMRPLASKFLVLEPKQIFGPELENFKIFYLKIWRFGPIMDKLKKTIDRLVINSVYE